jgi:hypothetical protein
LKVVRQLESQPPSSRIAQVLAFTYAALENREEALRWLAFEPPWFSLPWSLSWPEFDSLRDDPRFQDVVRRMNLEFSPGDVAPKPVPVVHPELPGAVGTDSSQTPL